MIAFVQGLAQLGWTDGRDVRPARAALAARDRVIENGPPAGSDISSKAWTEWHLYVVNDALTNFNRIGINTLATAARLPTIHGVREAVEAGGLMSYGADVSDLFRRAGNIVDKILRGMRPSDIPVEQPVKFDLVVNLIVAKALGLDLPPTLLSRADEVIE